MDKALFRAYVKELVKEQIQESVEKTVKRILPELLAEAVAEVKSTSGNQMVENTTAGKLPYDRSKFMAMMGMDRVGDTIVASTKNIAGTAGVVSELPPGMSPNDPTVKAINRNYSDVMKAMKLV